MGDDSLLLRERVQTFLKSLQLEMCHSLELFEESARFCDTRWDRPQGGGGITKVLSAGKVFEKAGVNFSAVWGDLPTTMASKFEVEPQEFFATGISSIIHPINPHVPTVHLNYRYFELSQGDAWFGGGIDLTPYYLYIADVKQYHTVLKSTCDRYDPKYYSDFKQWCDRYFYLPHRKETRGVGGLFFDYQREDPERFFFFVKECGGLFFDAYLPIVRKRQTTDFSEEQRRWQLIRRGRYVEFNLLYDRGTKFGLETGGQIESILVSMPPFASWEYQHVPDAGSPEAELLANLKPKDWLGVQTNGG